MCTYVSICITYFKVCKLIKNLHAAKPLSCLWVKNWLSNWFQLHNSIRVLKCESYKWALFDYTCTITLCKKVLKLSSSLFVRGEDPFCCFCVQRIYDALVSWKRRSNGLHLLMKSIHEVRCCIHMPQRWW